MIRQEKRVIALGFFDGVHMGHGALLRAVKNAADAFGYLPAAVTFQRHPKDLIPGAEHVSLINTPEDRAGLMKRLYGIEEVIALPFDEHMRDMPWQDFVTEVLVRQYGAAYLVAGHDYRFGAKGEGDTRRLAQLCAQLGLGCEVIGKVEIDGVTVSSTYIRALLQTGDMQRATRFLGHPHTLTGTVVCGQEVGRTIGIPTANLLLPAEVLTPAFGVYAAQVWVGEQTYMAVTNIGVRPTVNDGRGVTVEPWLLDFSGDLYGQTIRLELYRQLRGERKFSSLEALREEILRNAAQTRAYFGAQPEDAKTCPPCN